MVKGNKPCENYTFYHVELEYVGGQSYSYQYEQPDDENETGEGDKVNYEDADDDKHGNDISSENEGEIKLENLKENLNKEEEPLV